MKKVLVTGASGDIGREICICLSEAGYSVVAQYNSNKEGINKTMSLLKKIDGFMHESLQIDLNNYLEVQTKVKDLDVDALINNAGVVVNNLLPIMDYQSIEALIRINLLAPILLTQEILKNMIYKKSGVIINVSSISGQLGNAGQTVYSATKAGLIGLTKSLAKEYGARGIRTNCVSPGFIESDMTKGLNYNEIIKNIPMGRFGTPREIAEVVAFLVDEKSKYINGEVISINGGIIVN